MYLSRKTDETNRKAVEAMKKLNKGLQADVSKEVQKVLNQKIQDGSLNKNDINPQMLNEWARRAQTDILIKNTSFVRELHRTVDSLKFEAVLNTQQY